MRTKIGQLIKEEVERQGLTADQFAGLISTSRTNVYHIFNRENIDMELLVRISSALHRNFFTELYKDMSVLLGASEPPATMANYQLASLGSLISKEIDGCTYTFPEYSKDRAQAAPDFGKWIHLRCQRSGETNGKGSVSWV